MKFEKDYDKLSETHAISSTVDFAVEKTNFFADCCWELDACGKANDSTNNFFACGVFKVLRSNF